MTPRVISSLLRRERSIDVFHRERKSRQWVVAVEIGVPEVGILEAAGHCRETVSFSVLETSKRNNLSRNTVRGLRSLAEEAGLLGK